MHFGTLMAIINKFSGSLVYMEELMVILESLCTFDRCSTNSLAPTVMASFSDVSYLNEVDLFCLHALFLPRINSALDSCGIVHCQLHIIKHLTNCLFKVQQDITWSKLAHAFSCYTWKSGSISVCVSSSAFAPCSSLQHELSQIDMLRVTDDFGYTVYQYLCRIVGRHLYKTAVNYLIVYLETFYYVYQPC